MLAAWGLQPGIFLKWKLCWLGTNPAPHDHLPSVLAVCARIPATWLPLPGWPVLNTRSTSAIAQGMGTARPARGSCDLAQL